jgi:diguanylate cyclase (GGDEF)-like protein
MAALHHPILRVSWLAALAVGAWPLAADAQVSAARAAQAGRLAERMAEPVDAAVRRLVWLRYLWGPPGERLLHGIGAYACTALNDFEHADPHWARLAELSRRAGDAPGYLAALHARTEIAFFRGDYDAALRLKSTELEVARRHGLPLAEARAESGLGVILRRRGRLDQAVQHFQRALDLRRALGDRLGEADTLVQLASAQRNKGDYTRALDMLLSSLAIRERVGPHGRLDLSYRALGVLYREVEDFAKAQDVLEKALRHVERSGDPLALSPVLGSLAALYNDRGEPNQALTMARRALEIDEAYGNRSGVALGALEAGRALIDLRSYAEADAQLSRALALAHEMQQSYVAARARLYLALAAEQRGRIDEALPLLDAAAHEFRSEDARPLLLQALAARERILVARREWEQATAVAQQRAALREELLGVQSSRRLAGLAAEFEQQKQRQQIALLTKDNEIQALQLQRERLRRGFGLTLLAALAALVGLLAKRIVDSRRVNRELSERNREIAAQREQLADANRRLAQQAEALYRSAVGDPLTGIYNRGHLLDLLGESIRHAIAQRTELAVLMTDFDYFKAINDSRGHQFGDRVLVAGVECIRQSLRGSDFFGRYGGEELLIVLPGSDRATAVAVAERLRGAIAERMADFEGGRLGLTVSIGVAVLSQCPERSIEAIVHAADEALYAAKAAGRNRVVAWQPAAVAPALSA